METPISILLGFMIIGAIYSLSARDLLSAVISVGIVGYSLVICFLLLKAPDLAIVQIVVETITLVIMIAVVLDSTRIIRPQKAKGFVYFRYALSLAVIVIFAGVLLYMWSAPDLLQVFGDHTTRMSTAYIENAANATGSANLVTGVLFDFRGYDTLGEATVLFTAVVGVVTILRLKGKK